MNEYKYCNCGGFPRKTTRLYVRRSFQFIDGYKRKFIAIGYICEHCGEIVMDNKKKYILFEKYHILEFDYKQLQHNMDKMSLEQE